MPAQKLACLSRNNAGDLIAVYSGLRGAPVPSLSKEMRAFSLQTGTFSYP